MIEGMSDVDAVQATWDNLLKNRNSAIVQLFGGLYRSIQRCSCGEKSVKIDPSLFLQLQIPTGMSSSSAVLPKDDSSKNLVFTLDDLFAKYFVEEQMDDKNKWTGHTCLNKDTSTAFKKIEICKMPQILCIQLVRFKKYFVSSASETPTPIPQSDSTPTLTSAYTSTPDHDTPTPTPKFSHTKMIVVEKIDTRIHVPTELDLSTIVSHSVKYNLLAVCNHQGSLNSGHYTAFYHLDGVWWLASDEDVRKAKANEFEEITPTKAYYLFYVQKENITLDMESVIVPTTTQHPRQHYNLPLTEEQKQHINAGEAPLPKIVEDNTEFDNKIYGLCGKDTCKLAVETWWLGLTYPQLVTVRDFKEKVPLIKKCTKCSNPKNLGPKILKSMSKLKPFSVKESTYNNKVIDLFEIHKKE